MVEWLRYQLHDSSLGQINIPFLNYTHLEFGYPCASSAVECTTYKFSLVPGRYEIQCCGAQGASYTSVSNGGKGGCVKGTLALNEISVFYGYVGGEGFWNGRSFDDYAIFAGGWNGGGTCIGGAQGGGGATDIRLTKGDWNSTTGLRSRVLVGAGGGGANDYTNHHGGDGGGLVGGSGANGYDTITAGYCPNGGNRGGGGGTQTGGGLGFHNSGSFGIGSGSLASVARDGGGGGGGWYGGGKGYGCTASGGGGSSYISGHDGCHSIDANGAPVDSSVHFSGVTFSDSEMVSGARRGAGTISITALEINYTNQHKKKTLAIKIIFILLLLD